MDSMTGHMKADQRVFRRRVFYIPGYDPFHPRRYRELYRKEAAVQAAADTRETVATRKASQFAIAALAPLVAGAAGAVGG